MADADQYLYLFHHIPKCGGTSMKRALRQWFRPRRDYRPGWATGWRLERFRRRPLRLDRLRPGTVVCGHYEVEGIYLHQRYPDIWADPRVRIITFVREPLALRLSLLRYEQDHRRPGADAPFAERLLARPNWLADRFPLTADTMDAVLDRYDFIGTMDDVQGSWNRLADWLGKPRIHLPHLNRSTPRDVPLDDELRARFAATHALDLEIYRQCQQRAAAS